MSWEQHEDTVHLQDEITCDDIVITDNKLVFDYVKKIKPQLKNLYNVPEELFQRKILELKPTKLLITRNRETIEKFIAENHIEISLYYPLNTIPTDY
jgi:hypothetical protein